MAALTYDDSLQRNQRQRAYIDALRKQSQSPQGQMVSGHYVAPHWSEQLAPVLNQAIGGYMGRKQDEADKALAGQMEQGAQDWMSARPQVTQRVEQGPQPEGLEGTPVTSTQQPTQQDRLGWAMKGQMNPLTKALATQYGADVLIKEPEREEAREFRASESAAGRAQQLQIAQERLAQQAADAARRSEDTRLSAEQRAEAARDRTQMMGIMARMADETKRLQIEATKQAAADRTAAIRDKAEDAKVKLKNLPATQAKAWIENETALKKAQAVTEMLLEKDPTTKKPKVFKSGEEKFDPVAHSALSALNMLPFSEEVAQRAHPAGVPLRAAIGDIGSMKIHERSGAAVSAKEHPRLKPFVPSTADTPKAAYDKLQNFQREYQLIQQEILDYAESQGYKSPEKSGAEGKVKVYNPATGKLE
jgi:hypothetical protein